MKNLLLGTISILYCFGLLAQSSPKTPYKTENVLILIMDGPRYSETWGDPTHQYIPRMANDMAQHGIIYTQFRNNGPTYTCSGHTSLTTGIYQNLNNSGKVLPRNPSIFQYWRKQTGKAKNSVYVISSKDKLEVLANCKNKKWKDQYLPASDCGVNGLESGYRSDKVTFDSCMIALKRDRPNLALVNFRLPDSWGHAGNWEKYLTSITLNDELIYKIFDFVRTDPHYKDKTTIFVTNDHGRHLDGVKDGFVSHGDNCEGCRHINCFAYGPDFKEGIITDIPRELIDITATTCELLGISMEKQKGKVMRELFNDCQADPEK